MIPFLLIAAGGYLVGQSYRNQNYERGGRVLLAPNGKPSNLNPGQYKLVRTPEFKAWFGDWENEPKKASKVVDENGEPLVVYHGSDNVFNVFKSDKQIYFATNKEYSILLTDSLKESNTRAFFLNIRNLLDATKFDLNDYSHKEYKTFLANNGVDVRINKTDDKSITKFWYLIATTNVSDAIKEKYDGFSMYENMYAFQGKLDEEEGDDPSTKVYVCFKPNQIKLADGTNTTFDDSNPDIRFDKGGNVDYTLDAICEIRTDFPEADFWLQRKGSEKTIGKPKKGYYAEDIGIKIRPEYQGHISPEYIYYSLEYLHRKGVFENMAVGSLALKNLRVSDVKALPIAFGIRK